MSSGVLIVAVLAAGASRRLGRPKQLVELPDGGPVLRRQCRVALEARVGPVIAILGCRAEACAAVIADLPVAVRVNDQWEEGLASSIRCAAGAATGAGADGLLILHGDQYRVTHDDLGSLRSAWEDAGRAKAARARHDGYLGPPVILPAACFAAAMELRGDDGARAVLAGLGRGAVLDVTMPNAAVDLDLPTQLTDVAGG